LILWKVQLSTYFSLYQAHRTDTSQKILYAAIPVYLTGLTLTKISILLQYMRLFQGKTVQRIIIGMLIFVAAFGEPSLALPLHQIRNKSLMDCNKNRNMVNPRSLTHLHPHPLLLGYEGRCQMHELCSKMVQRRCSQYPHRFYPLEYPYAISQRPQSTLPSKSRVDSCVCSRRLVS
jgi:hypothetical protein